MNTKPYSDKDFEELFLEYFSPLTVFAWQKVNDRMMAEDIVHDVFTEIYDNRDKKSVDNIKSGYLYRAVHYRCLNEIRRRKMLSENESGILNTMHPSSDDPFEEIKNIEFEHKYYLAVKKLPPRCRMIFEMSRKEGKKNAEIAMELSLSQRTVETQISKAIRILKRLLMKYI